MHHAPDPSDSPGFYDPTWGQPCLDRYENSIVARIEDRAESEIQESARVFTDWCGENLDAATLSQIIALAGRFRDENARAELSDVIARIRKDYTDYRVELAQRNGEWDEIGMEEHAAAREEAAEARADALREERLLGDPK